MSKQGGKVQAGRCSREAPCSISRDSTPAALDAALARPGEDASNACPAGNSEVSSTLHWGPFYTVNNYWRTTDSMELEGGKPFSDDYHTFGLSWDEKGL